jgi:hypothetical protein
LRVPWRPGQNGNPQGKRGDEYLETIRLARQASPETMRKLIAKTDSNDDRVALVAMQAILDRAWGKPRDYDPKSAQAGGLRIDVGKLTSEQRQLLLAIIQSGAVRQATCDDDTDITTVDATATETRPA